MFTSPSNVNSFFASQKPQTQVTYIAIGNSTAKELQKHNVAKIIVAKGFSDIDLLAAVFEI